MRKVALRYLGGLLLGHALWASGEFEEEERIAPTPCPLIVEAGIEGVPAPRPSVLEDYITRHPYSISVVLGAPSEKWSFEFRGDHLYLDEEAKDPTRSCLQLSWERHDFLEKVAPLVGKVSYLYLVPTCYKTKTRSPLDVAKIFTLLGPWGKFYYQPAFVEASWDASYGILREFARDLLPVQMKAAPKKKKVSRYIQKTFEPPITALLKRHFEEVAIFVTLGDARENTYRGEKPLIHQEVRDPLSIRNVHKAFGPYFESKKPEHFIWKPSYPLVLGRLCEEKVELLREKVNVGGTIFLHPQGKRPLDVGYGLIFGWERAHENPFTLPLSWQDPALFKKLSPLEGKITHLFALPGRTACDDLDLDKIEMRELMRLLTKDAVMLVEPLPRFVTADQNATIESLNYLTGIPLFYDIPDLPGVFSLTEKLRQTRAARTAFLRKTFYPHLCERLGAYFAKTEWLEARRVDEYDKGTRSWLPVPELLLGLKLTGVRQDF
jgi:hypothetical protein